MAHTQVRDGRVGFLWALAVALAASLLTNSSQAQIIEPTAPQPWVDTIVCPNGTFQPLKTPLREYEAHLGIPAGSLINAFSRSNAIHAFLTGELRYHPSDHTKSVNVSMWPDLEVVEAILATYGLSLLNLLQPLFLNYAFQGLSFGGQLPEDYFHLDGALLGCPAGPASSVMDVKRPRDYAETLDATNENSSLGFASLDHRTYAVEFEINKSTFQQYGLAQLESVLGIAPQIEQGLFPGVKFVGDPYPAESKTRLYGWYVKGKGIKLPATGGRRIYPLFVFIDGTGFPLDYALRFDPSRRKMMQALVASGFDILVMDPPGQGYSSGIREFRGSIIFESLKALELGCMTRGPEDDAPVVRNTLLGNDENGFPYTAESKPIVLAGWSWGAVIAERAMAMKFSGHGTIDSYPTYDPSVIDPHDFNLRGVVSISGAHGSPYATSGFVISGLELNNMFGPVFNAGKYYNAGSAVSAVAFGALALFDYDHWSLKEVYDTIDAWPAYMGVQTIADYSSSTVLGPVMAYNRARGFKELVILPGDHWNWFTDLNLANYPGDGLGSYGTENNPASPVFDHVLARMLLFASQAVLQTPPMTDFEQTTVGQEVCAMPDSGEVTRRTSSRPRVLQMQ